MSTTLEGSPVRTAEQRRRRRQAAGRCGGTFELIRDGDKLTYRYASTDRRRNELNGEFSWEANPASRSQDDFNPIDIRDQHKNEASPASSEGSKVDNNRGYQSTDDLDETLVEQIEQNRRYASTHRDEYVESVYSRDSSGEEVSDAYQTTLLPLPRNCGNSEDAPACETSARSPNLGEGEGVWWKETGCLDDIKKQDGKAKDLRFAGMKSFKGFGNKLVQKGKDAKVVQKINRIISLAFRGPKSTHASEGDYPIVARKRDIGRLPDLDKLAVQETAVLRSQQESPVKEQLRRENDRDADKILNKEFFTPPANRKKPTKRVAKNGPDEEIFD